LWHKSMQKLIETKEGEKKFAELMFGKRTERKPTEIEIIRNEIKYCDELISSAISFIEGVTDDKKEKIVEDAIKYKKIWLQVPEFLPEKKVSETKQDVKGRGNE
ncbi:hypothetical protein LCGC14_2463630, partial [marine sediment metagenome]